MSIDEGEGKMTTFGNYIPLQNLWGPDWKVDRAFMEFAAGRKVHSRGPIKVARMSGKNFFVVDGTHRVIERILTGSSVIEAEEDFFLPTMSTYQNAARLAVRFVDRAKAFY